MTVSLLIFAVLATLIAVEELTFRRKSVGGRSPERERLEAEASSG